MSLDDELNNELGIVDSEEETDNIVTLNDEDGNEINFEFLDIVEYRNESYVILLPCDDDSGEVLILKICSCDDNDREEYISVEDDEVLQAVFNIFKEKFKDLFNFTD